MSKVIQELEKEAGEYLQLDLTRSNLTTYTSNVIILDEFFKIQSVFEANNVAIMPLKGVALLFSVYKDIGLRPMVDIDFLIRQEDLGKAVNLLSDLGYEKEDTGPFNYFKLKGKKRLFLDMQYSLWYLKTLSWAKSRIYGIDNIWQNSRRVYLDRNFARVMAPEDLLINVATHAGVDHGKPNDIWICDIVKICQQYRDRLNWHMFINKVVSYGIQIPVHYVLECANARFQGQIPQFVLDELRPKKNNSLQLRLYNKALKQGYIPRIGHLLRILIISRLSGQIRLILFYLFPDKQFMKLRYKIKNNNLVYFYYPLRIKSFLPKTIKIFIKLVKT